MDTPTPQKYRMQDISILAWVLENELKSEKGEPLDWSDRLFLLPILADWSKEIVIKKCSQVGGSVVFNLKAFFALLKWGLNVIYTMPTDGDVESFAKTKTNPLITNNPHVLGDMSGDSIYLKQVGGRNLHLKGTVSKTAAISTSADLNVHDEASRSDQAMMEQYKSRLDASPFKGRWFFSNPTTEKDIVDQKWHESDKKEWYVKCSNGHEDYMSWPDSIDLARKVFCCRLCKVELSREQRRRGRWIATAPGKAISGYHISHLMAPWKTAPEIIADSEGDQEYFYNFVLGEPYNPGDLRVSRATILDNWTPKDLTTGKWFLGVDVGNVKHYVLGSETGAIKVGKFTDWQVLDDIMAMYKPAYVIDANPDNTMARYFVDKYPNGYMSVFKENADNPQTLVWWGHNTNMIDAPGNREGIVYSNRNRIIDQLIDRILRAEILFGVASDRVFKDFVAHWETLRRVKVVNAKGIESYEWQSTTGQDHFVFATLYYYLALLGGRQDGVLLPATGGGDLPELIKGDTMGDIGDIIEQANRWQ